MIFFIYSQDKPDSFELRKATRPEHLEYLKKFESRFVSVGPTMTDDGAVMDGSVLLVEFPDRSAAEEFRDNDPYAKAGLFQSSIIKAWMQVYPVVG
jgi:hypothetical protein